MFVIFKTSNKDFVLNNIGSLKVLLTFLHPYGRVGAIPLRIPFQRYFLVYESAVEWLVYDSLWEMNEYVISSGWEICLFWSRVC